MDVESDFFNETSYQVNDDVAIPVYADVQTYPCANCGRSFNAESLRKHQPICKKTTTHKSTRKVFDMGKQRATDSDVPYAATRETTKFYHEGTKPKLDQRKTKKNNWREDHQILVRTIREARHSVSVVKPPPPVSTQSSSDYIQCQFCQRHFNHYSAERHIPFCETQLKRKQARNVRPSLPVHPINSAPSKSSPGTTTADKSFRRAPPTFRRAPTKNVVQRAVKPVGNYLFGKQRGSASPQVPRRKTPTTEAGPAKHCHQCGEAFPVASAKFCCECGEKRHGLE